MIYLDNCATSKPSKLVMDEILLAMNKDFANPSSLHSFGHEIEKKVQRIRKNIKSYLGALSGEIIFTSGGTESNNMALNYFINHKLSQGNKVITSNIEHPSVLEYLKSRKDIILEILPVEEDGRLNTQRLLEAIDEKTIVLSLFHVNNELGTIHNLEEIVPEIKKRHPDLLVHIDGVQAVGKIPINLGKISCDSYSFSGHKFHGPKGIGGLYIKNKDKFMPLLFGGGQEFGLRSGTYNTIGIYGMGQAIKELSAYDKGHFSAIKEMKAYMIKEIQDNIEGVKINSVEPASPFMVNMSIADTRGEVLLHMLEEKDIYISTSSACSSHKSRKNPVLMAIGLEEKYLEGTIRVCLSHMSYREEIEVFCRSLIEAVQEIRSITGRK